MTVHDLFVGIDGCPAGWFFVGIGRDDRYQFDIEERFAELGELLLQARLTLVDIPIGLCADEREERLCDKAARRAIAPRGSTVFPAPARGALGKGSYAEGSAENFRLTGRKLSRQSWAIARKIEEVDTWLRRAPAADRIREMHPEVAFWALNDKVPLLNRKKTKVGLAERLAVLSRHYARAEACYQAARRKFRRREVHDDDIVDALAGAVTARYDGQLATLPEHPARDVHGLPMEIVYADLGCPFCQPGADRVLYEDGLVRAFPDAYPVSPGHTLIVPMRHVGTWFEATAEEKLALISAIDQVKEILERDHRPTGWNIGVNSGRDAGQTVPHLHLHLIPRYHGDSEDPRGGVRNILPARARWWEQG